MTGVGFSNTKFFEESRGWRGLLIEPNRVEYEKIFNNRPEAIAVNAAVCAKNQDVHFISKRLAGSAGMGSWVCLKYAGICTTMRSICLRIKTCHRVSGR